ncbi:MAG TPA: ABC transporter permease [Thermomicrobiales bacterium]|jgi:osmoprotectant transport system permease protein
MRDSSPNFIAYIRDHQEQFNRLLLQHLQLTVVAVLLAVVLALPLAVLANRSRFLAGPLTALTQFGQTIPSLALLGLALPILGIGFKPAVFALTIGAIMPIFLNAYIGLHNTDRALVDAARGMGMNRAQRLLLAELPLASPVIWAGIRTATVQTIASATLAAFIGGGGLGDFILLGLSVFDNAVLLAGAIPVALLALGADIAMGGLRRLVIPTGLRAGTR